jgi:beta-glucanase (GH16 family)
MCTPRATPALAPPARGRGRRRASAWRRTTSHAAGRATRSSVGRAALAAVVALALWPGCDDDESPPRGGAPPGAGGTTSAGAAGAPPPGAAGAPPPAGTAGAAGASPPAGAAGAAGATPLPWQLVWADEFEGPAGAPVDATKWAFDEGGTGWGNNELQYYTSRPENASLDGEGRLVITARAETFGGRDYTSARLKTQGLVAFTYGRFEARLKVPFGNGLWPAFWSLGANIDAVGWPACGEIDVMEFVGRAPATVYGTVHGPGYSGGNAIGGTVTLPRPPFEEAHTYAAEWEPDAIRWYVDDRLYFARTRDQIERDGRRWAFDGPFFLLLNVAVGGFFPGAPDASTTFPQTMAVEYVRVYQRGADAAAGAGGAAGATGAAGGAAGAAGVGTAGGAAGVGTAGGAAGGG